MQVPKNAVMQWTSIILLNQKCPTPCERTLVVFLVVEGATTVPANFQAFSPLMMILNRQFRNTRASASSLSASLFQLAQDLVKKNGSARRLRGIRFLTGLLSFFAICSVGVIANVSIAAAVFQQHYAW
jgi:dolichol-phosphate mannosyltransferase